MDVGTAVSITERREFGLDRADAAAAASTIVKSGPAIAFMAFRVTALPLTWHADLSRGFPAEPD